MSKMPNSLLQGTAVHESWALKVPFVISRSSRTHVDVVTVTVTDGTYIGRGECQPNTRYGETIERTLAELNACFPASFDKLRNSAKNLQSFAARNALDCALLDYQAKASRRQVCDIIDAPPLLPVRTVFTLSVDSPENMASAALTAFGAGKKHLKLKLGGPDDMARLAAVRAAVPEAVLVADANEGWTAEMLAEWMPRLADLQLAMLEQPLPDGHDEALRDIPRLIPICADESCHTARDVAALKGKYDLVNIKLDKTGGLTPALELLAEAKRQDMGVMVGCMLGTSLAMAPALYVAQSADFVDLDGPLLLREDREDKMIFDADLTVHPPPRRLWG